MTNSVAVGDWVRLKRVHRGCRMAKVTRLDGHFYYIQTDAVQDMLCVRDDFTRKKEQTGVNHEFFPMRKTLPYGRYNCHDNTHVLFNRDYEPICRILSDGKRVDCDPREWIKHKSEDWFYSDGHEPCNDRNLFNKLVKIVTGKCEVSSRDICYSN